MKNLKTCIDIILVISFTISAAPPTEGLMFLQSAGASCNPIGINLESRLLYRKPVWNKTGILWESAKFELGLKSDWTPADEFLGLQVNFEPVAFFDISISGGYYGIYNWLGYGCYRFSNSRPDYGDRVRDTMPAASVSGYKISGSPTIKVQAGSFIAAYSFSVNAIMVNVPDYYLELRSFLIHKAQDADMSQSVFMFLKPGEKLLAGLNYLLTRVIGADARSQRVSALVIYTPKTAKIEGLTIIGVAGGYLVNPLYRFKPYTGVQATADFRISAKPPLPAQKDL